MFGTPYAIAYSSAPQFAVFVFVVVLIVVARSACECVFFPNINRRNGQRLTRTQIDFGFFFYSNHRWPSSAIVCRNFALIQFLSIYLLVRRVCVSYERAQCFNGLSDFSVSKETLRASEGDQSKKKITPVLCFPVS